MHLHTFCTWTQCGHKHKETVCSGRNAAADQWAHKPRALCQLRTIPATKTHRLNITRYAPMSDRKLQAFSAEPRTTADVVSGGHFGSFKPYVNFKCFFFHPRLSSATDCCIVIVVDIDIFSKTGVLCWLFAKFSQYRHCIPFTQFVILSLD